MNVTDDCLFVYRRTVNKQDLRKADLQEIEPLHSKSREHECLSKPARLLAYRNGAGCTKGYAGLSALTQLRKASNIFLAVRRTTSILKQLEGVGGSKARIADLNL